MIKLMKAWSTYKINADNDKEIGQIITIAKHFLNTYFLIGSCTTNIQTQKTKNSGSILPEEETELKYKETGSPYLHPLFRLVKG